MKSKEDEINYYKRNEKKKKERENEEERIDKKEWGRKEQ